MDTLFKLVNGEITLHNAILNNKNIKNLIRRDRGGLMAGDANGLKKLRSFAEIGLIWYCININSPGLQRGLSGKELVSDGMNYFNIPDEWKPDEQYQLVYEWYKEDYNNSVVVKAIKAVLSGFERSLNLVEKVNLALSRYELQGGEIDIDGIDKIMKLNNNLMSMSNELPKQVKALKDLEILYLKEEKHGAVGRGKISITSSMIPPK